MPSPALPGQVPQPHLLTMLTPKAQRNSRHKNNSPRASMHATDALLLSYSTEANRPAVYYTLILRLAFIQPCRASWEADNIYTLNLNSFFYFYNEPCIYPTTKSSKLASFRQFFQNYQKVQEFNINFTYYD